MPLHKFRSIEEMNAFDLAQRRASITDPNLARRIENHWNRCRGLTLPLDVPAGVHKFRSIEEMNAFKDRYADARIARIRAERVIKDPV